MEFDHELLLSQYSTLRNEIENSKDRMFKIVAGQVFVVPGAQYLAIIFGNDTFKLVLPFLVIVLAVAYVAENNALYRAGGYIKDYIEPRISDDENFLGWENWLEVRKAKYDVKQCARNADKLLNIDFCILTILYYIISVSIASASSLIPEAYTDYVQGIYYIIGCLSFAILISLCRTSTTQRSYLLNLWCSYVDKDNK